MKKHEIVLSEKTTYEAIGELNSRRCKQVANDEGMRFTSLTDAAKYAGVSPQNMWSHLNGNHHTCKGHVYFYVDKRDESFNAVMKCLAKTTEEINRRKADEEDARKWREYQAEQEAIRKAEERRLEEERKARERHAKAVAAAEAKVNKYAAECNKYQDKYNEALNAYNEATKELERLLEE